MKSAFEIVKDASGLEYESDLRFCKNKKSALFCRRKSEKM